MRNLYEELFGFRREFDEMFNRVLSGKPWAEWAERPAFTKELNFTPAVEAYVDKEGKKYVCRVTLPGVDPKDFQVHAQGNLLTIHGERKFTHNIEGGRASRSRKLLTVRSRGRLRCPRA